MTLPKITELEFSDSDFIQQSNINTVHKTFAWDFETGDFVLKDGKLVEVEGIEYLKIWIEKALRTAKGTLLIYDGTEYGSEHYSLIGRNFHADYIRAEIERMIQEALLLNNAITLVDKFSFSQTGAKLIVAFDVQSIYGSTREKVTI